MVMKKTRKIFKLIINYDLLDEFCKVNNFIIITEDMLIKNNMYKELIYATNNNFIGKSIYPNDMPLIMNKEIWNKLIRINNDLKRQNLGLKIYDAYRPNVVQKIFWEYFYDINGYYDETLVANPNKYSMHNITLNAIDISLVNLDGKEVELPCSFDDFTLKANIYFNDCNEKAKENRDLLINTAKKHGLMVNTDEWWHFYCDSLKKYGMKYDYSKSKFVPKLENKVFSIEEY